MKGEYYSDLCALIVYSVQVLNPTMTKSVCVCGGVRVGYVTLWPLSFTSHSLRE